MEYYMCQPTVPAVYRTPAIVGIVPTQVPLAYRAPRGPSDFTGTITAIYSTGTIGRPPLVKRQSRSTKRTTQLQHPVLY